jgi:hypothetical protein
MRLGMASLELAKELAQGEEFPPSFVMSSH